jgi:hypothetical protein
MNNNKKILLIVILTLISIINLYNLIPTVNSWGPGPNYKNFSSRTTVNVTNAYPEILAIICDEGTPITLAAGTTDPVNCSVQIRDFDGGNTITNVTGQFYYQNTSGWDDPNDNNDHYTNLSCTEDNTNGYYTNWTCGFMVWFYANNGTWQMEANVTDDQNFSSFENGSATMEILLAVNASDVIDFGDMAVGDTSLAPVQANLTNYGNVDINVTLYGFGGNDSGAPGAGTVSMFCTFRNISLTHERWGLNSTGPHSAMTSITNSPVLLPDFELAQETVDGTWVTNSTYWSLYLDVIENPAGQCNGTVVFSAEEP